MKKKILPFLCGALTATICVSTALAGASYSGRISFNTNSLYLNGHEILPAGESLVTESGAEVPSSILYTDEHGGGTYYVPVRPLAHALEMPVTWEENAILWKVEGDLAVKLLPTSSKNLATFNGCIQEVAAVVPVDGYELMSHAHKGVENFEAWLELKDDKGDTVSVTVTNHGPADLVFGLGAADQDGEAGATTRIRVSVGETVTRTFTVLDKNATAIPYLNIGNSVDTSYEHSFSVQALQF